MQTSTACFESKHEKSLARVFPFFSSSSSLFFDNIIESSQSLEIDSKQTRSEKIKAPA